MLTQLKQRLRKEILDPGIASIFFNPYYFIKKSLITGLRLNAKYIHGTVLDFGCGNRSYEHLFDTESMVGLEVQQSGHNHSGENIDIFYDGKTIPFKNTTFDSILSIEVFEHVFNLGKILDELNRVLKPGGYILITYPFVWEEHEQPFDFGRYTSFGIRHLLETHDFSVTQMYKGGGFIETIFQLWNVYLYKKILSRFRLLQILCVPLLIFPANLIGCLLTFLLPKNSDIFLNTVVIAKKR